MTETPASSAFRLAYVPGVTPAKWARVWTDRLPETPLDLVLVQAGAAEPAVRSGDADAGLVRLPVDKTDLHAIPLYTETTVVVMPKDHRLAEAAEVPVAELAEELVLHPQDDVLGWDGQPPGQAAKERPETTKDALELVAAGIGVVLVPQSLARLHHRRDLTYRPVPEGDAPQSQIALAWRQDRGSELVEEMIGIVRGRTVNSSRGSTATAAANQAPKQKPSGRKPASSQPQQKQQSKQQPKQRQQKPAARGGKPGAKGGRSGRRG
ncbi:LysR family substrate-binding domain-containing protein [Streptacidiphilus jiangxiensis]|uniref:LysR substrate binding domain-containing protein n=1 Tax=Streptacidiphilus jiangxiensis TaxID=235985 RepID=A0A1H7V976_STRJI|nr:LysR family substrate-binding domain-containing protein [Streptacidiphilus jiangxiensis]SEM05752.1 LysR substrate binding domain-containing protein [Streptacidiphilus jiangxiensis]